MLSWPTLEGDLAGKNIPRQTPEVVKRDERVVVGDGAGIIRMKRRKNSTRRPAARLLGVGPTVPRETARSVSVAARRDINPSARLIGSAACVVKAIRRRSAPTSSLFSPGRTPRAPTTKVTRPSEARKRKPLYVTTCQASKTMSRMVREVSVRSLGKWGISRLYAIVEHHVKCLTHQLE